MAILSTTQVMSTSLLLPGSRTFSPITVPQGATRFKLSYDITQITDPGNRIVTTLDLSLDGGVTWFGDKTDFGGYSQWIRSGRVEPINVKTGSPLTKSSYSFLLPEPENSNRMVRISILVDGNTVTTDISLEFT